MNVAGQSPDERLRPIYQEMAEELRRRESWLLFILDPPYTKLFSPALKNLDGYTDAELRFLAAADLVKTALGLRLFFAAGAFLFAVNTALSLFGSRGANTRDWALLAIELSLALFFSYGLWRTPADHIAFRVFGDPAAALSAAEKAYAQSPNLQNLKRIKAFLLMGAASEDDALQHRRVHDAVASLPRRLVLNGDFFEDKPLRPDLVHFSPTIARRFTNAELQFLLAAQIVSETRQRASLIVAASLLSSFLPCAFLFFTSLPLRVVLLFAPYGLIQGLGILILTPREDPDQRALRFCSDPAAALSALRKLYEAAPSPALERRIARLTASHTAIP